MLANKCFDVITQYNKSPLHAGYSALYDLEMLLKQLGFPIRNFSYQEPSFKRSFFGRKSALHVADEPKNQTILICCYTPSFLCELNFISGFLNKYDRIAVYFLDGFDSESFDKTTRTALKKVDVIYSFIEEVVEDLTKAGFDSRFLPLGADCLAFSGAALNLKDRYIDVIAYGRKNESHHKVLTERFNSLCSDYIYVHDTSSSSYLQNAEEHRKLYLKLLSRSKISLCYEASNVSRFINRSPILYRWFEAFALGCTAVGKAPKCHAATTLLNWSDSTIEAPKNDNQFYQFITELLKENKFLNTCSVKNRRHALERHDWRYRIRDICDDLNVATPQTLRDELVKLALMSKNCV